MVLLALQPDEQQAIYQKIRQDAFGGNINLLYQIGKEHELKAEESLSIGLLDDMHLQMLLVFQTLFALTRMLPRSNGIEELIIMDTTLTEINLTVMVYIVLSIQFLVHFMFKIKWNTVT